MLGHYNRLCHVIMHNTHKMWGLIYLCTMGKHCLHHATWYCMCSDIMHASCGMHMQASQPPYVYMACQELLMDMQFIQAKQYLSKLPASHISTLNTKIANQNMLKRILIAMHNKNKADCNENFRMYAEEPVAPLYKW